MYNYYDDKDKNETTQSDPSPLAFAIAVSNLVNDDAVLHQDFELCESHLETGGFGRSR